MVPAPTPVMAMTNAMYKPSASSIECPYSALPAGSAG